MSGFPTRSRAMPACGDRFRYDEHIAILPPTVPEAPIPPPICRSHPLPHPPRPFRIFRPRKSPTIPDRRHSVRAWRVGGLSRADYCRQRGLNPRAFNQGSPVSVINSGERSGMSNHSLNDTVSDLNNSRHFREHGATLLISFGKMAL
jgi:hypothetical protein